VTASYQFCQADPISRAVMVRRSDNAFIPMSMDNADCRQFLLDWHGGATVINADSSSAAYSDAAVTALGLTPP